MNEPLFDVQSLIQPDVFLPSQFVDRHRPLVSSPLRRLSYAVLDQSLHDAGLYALVNRRPGNPRTGRGANPAILARRSRHFADARAWLEDERADQLFSFNGVCSTLGIHPDSFKRRLLELLDAEREQEAA